MRSAESIFLSKLDTLFQLVHADDTNSLIDACAILRLLLLDGEPLVHTVNRRYRLSIEFIVGNTGVDDYPNHFPRPAIHIVDPIMASKNRQTLDFRSFLAFKCVAIDGEVFAVRDLIKYGAHVLEAVSKIER